MNIGLRDNLVYRLSLPLPIISNFLKGETDDGGKRMCFFEPPQRMCWCSVVDGRGSTENTLTGPFLRAWEFSTRELTGSESLFRTHFGKTKFNSGYM